MGNREEIEETGLCYGYCDQYTGYGKGDDGCIEAGNRIKAE